MYQVDHLLELIGSSKYRVDLNDGDFNILISSLRLIYAISRGATGDLKSWFCEMLPLSSLGGLINYLCEWLVIYAKENASVRAVDPISNVASSAGEGAAVSVSVDGGPNSKGKNAVPAKLAILCSLALESATELLIGCYTPYGTVVYPLACCFESSDGNNSSCGACPHIRGLINIADKVSQVVHYFILHNFGIESEAIVVDNLCRILGRIGQNFDLSQSKPIVSQLCRLIFKNPDEFDLNQCSFVNVLSAYSGFRIPYLFDVISPTGSDCRSSADEMDDARLFNPGCRLKYFRKIKYTIDAQITDPGVDDHNKGGTTDFSVCVLRFFLSIHKVVNPSMTRSRNGAADPGDNNHMDSANSSSNADDSLSQEDVRVRLIKKATAGQSKLILFLAQCLSHQFFHSSEFFSDDGSRRHRNAIITDESAAVSIFSGNCISAI
jgi:hypothetical protein